MLLASDRTHPIRPSRSDPTIPIRPDASSVGHDQSPSFPAIYANRLASSFILAMRALMACLATERPEAPNTGSTPNK